MTEPLAGELSPFFRHTGGRVYGVGIVLVFGTLYLANPYRDEGLWKQAHATEGAPAIGGLRVTENKARAITLVREMLADVRPGSRVMIVGAHPWIYFATDTQPDTDMIFMHFTGGPLAYQILASRMKDRRPEYLIVAGQSNDVVNQAVIHIASAGSYVCTSRRTPISMQRAIDNVQTYYDMLPDLIVCRAGAPSLRP